MSVVDFGVDKDAIGLLSFISSAERMLTGDDLLLNHPGVDWSSQKQHLFRDNLRAAALKLVVSESGKSSRLISFAEFDASYELLDTEALKALAMIFKRCKNSLTENVIFWVRVTGYAYACAQYLKSRSGSALGFQERRLPIEEMIQATEDRHYISQLELYQQRLKSILSEGF